MYKELKAKGFNTVILADSAGLFDDKSYGLMDMPVGRLHYWCNSCGEINLPGSSSVTNDVGQLPERIRGLYNSYQEETGPFRTYTVTLNEHDGMLATLLVDKDWVNSVLPASDKKEASDEDMSIMYEALVRVAIQLRGNLGLPIGCTILVLKDADPDGHELGIFFPDTVCTYNFPKFKASTLGVEIYEDMLQPTARQVFWQMRDAKKIHRCPKCGGMTFGVSAHVAQDWVVDENGNYQKCSNQCAEVTHGPADDDVWCCTVCGYDAPGAEFLSAPAVLDAMGLREKKKAGYKRVHISISGYAIVPGDTDEEALKHVMGLTREDFDWEPVNDDVLQDAEVIEDCGPNGESI